ncbi:MAG: DegT/DnrJ/EryC1/StrS family aminotransferase [Ruminococcaceae bacterium]|nr:DegT/DnrJ/EryC1/StrS family aminotransferase [Oscillospiraceae bacterium]
MPTDFRYNTGDTAVPWAAVGENYNANDVMEVIRFLMQGEGKEYDEALKGVYDKIKDLDKISTPPGKLTTGRLVEEAEQLCNEYLNTDSSTFLTNATAGLELGYKYANLKAGDEVIVPAITFVATIAYPLSIGCKLVFADIDPKTINMDPKDVEKKITSKTKAIVPVHIGGYAVDMDPIMEIAKKYDLVVIEDAAHGFGGTYKGKKLGTIGHFGSYSFHEVKNITSFGEGGIAVSSIPGYGSEMKRARFLGLDFSAPIKNWLYNVSPISGKEGPFIAGNHSPTEIQALGLKLQIARNEEIIKARRVAAEYLNSRLSANDAIITQDLGTDDTKPTFHLYLLQIDPAKAGGDIQVLKQKLEEKGVTNIPHFGPLYRFKAVSDMGIDVDAAAASCPVCEEVFYKRFTHLPLYGLTKEQLDHMANAVLESVKEMQEGK